MVMGFRDTEIVQGENPDVVFVIDESGKHQTILSLKERMLEI